MADWEGATLKATYQEKYANDIVRCFQPFKSAAWDRAFDESTFKPHFAKAFELRESPDVEPRAWTLLHYAATGNAPAAIVTKLVELGANRSAKDWLGRIPLEVASPSSSAELLAALKPVYKLQGVCEGQLDAIETNFHRLIHEVTHGQDEENQLALPTVRTLLEEQYIGQDRGMSFPVPGMYGGFYGIHLELSPDGKQVSHLTCESWCRVVGGSGRRDKVTAEGTELLESGFV